MSEPEVKVKRTLGRSSTFAAQRLAEVAKRSSRSLARIARAYAEYESGRCDADRLIEVVRQETRRAATQPRQVRRRSRPVWGKAEPVHAATPATSNSSATPLEDEGESGPCSGAAIG